MRRIALTAATCLGLFLAAPAGFAQNPKTPPPAAPAQAPATPAKYYRPVKGIAAIQVIPGPSKKVGADIVTAIKIKNMASGAIALLKIDEYWYDKSGQIVSSDTQSYRKPFNPGEIIEMTMRSPYRPGLASSQYMYSHVNGKIDVKGVKKFDDVPPKKK
jgi:hypothetical protein